MRSFWNERAREDAFYFVDNRQPYRRGDPAGFWDAEELLDYALGVVGVELTGDEQVAEIGCGVGRITRVLAARAREVYAFDVSDEMLERARSLHPEVGNVHWLLGDGETLRPLGDESIDAVVSTVVLQHVPDPEITLGYVREVGRVLRTGGWAALQVSNDPRVHRSHEPLSWRIKALVGRAPRGQRDPEWIGSWVDLDRLREVATGASLDVERVWGAGTQYCEVLLRRR